MNNPETPQPDKKKLSQAINKLDKVHKQKLDEAKTVGQMKEDLEFTKAFFDLKPMPSDVYSMAALASGAQMVDGLSAFIINKDLNDFQGEGLAFVGTTLGSSVSFVVTHSTIIPKKVASQEFDKLRVHIDKRDDLSRSRTYVKSQLALVDKVLVKVFDGVWDSLELKEINSAGKAAGSMKDVVTHVLKHFAPNNKIKEQADFVSCEESKDKVSRRHRYEFIAKHLIKDQNKRDLFESSIKAYLDTQDALNKSHYPNDHLALKESVVQALYILEMIFKSVQ